MDRRKSGEQSYGHSFRRFQEIKSLLPSTCKLYKYRTLHIDLNFCLFKGNYYLKNMTFNDKYFPPIVPAAYSYYDFQLYTYRNGKARKTYFLRPYLEVKIKRIFYW